MKTRALSDIDIFTGDLPPVMVNLIELLGVALAVRLVVAFAGQKRYINPPEALSDEHELVLLLGFEAAKKLCFTYQREHLEYPTAKSAISMFRRQLVIDMNKAGFERSEIVGSTAFSNRNVKRILEGKAIITNVVPKAADNETLPMFP